MRAIGWVLGGGAALLAGGIFAATTRQPQQPPGQVEILGVYADFARQWNDARGNDLAREPLRAGRFNRLCRDGNRPATVHGWLATIEQVRTTPLGEHVSVTLRLSPAVTIRTNNPLDGAPERTTVIHRNDPMALALMQMRAGDRVRFAAELLPSNQDCIAEASLTLSGGMTAPELLMRLTAIEPAR